MWRVWSDAEFAGKVRDLGEEKRVLKTEPKPEPKPPTPSAAVPKKGLHRSEAVSLLAVLQREARLIDFIKEPIAGYSDAQVGAAVRDLHKNCAAVLDRLFALQPFNAAAEGAPVEVPRNFDAAQFRVTGNVTGEPPFRGTLRHHGWKAAKCELPEWTGSEASALIVAPAEVEVK